MAKNFGYYGQQFIKMVSRTNNRFGFFYSLIFLYFLFNKLQGIPKYGTPYVTFEQRIVGQLKLSILSIKTLPT